MGRSLPRGNTSTESILIKQQNFPRRQVSVTGTTGGRWGVGLESNPPLRVGAFSLNNFARSLIEQKCRPVTMTIKVEA